MKTPWQQWQRWQWRRACVWFCLVIFFLNTSACAIFGGKDASPMKKFVSQLDNNSIAAREYQLSLQQFLFLQLLSPDRARSLSDKGEAFRAANRQVIDFLQKYVTLNAEGQRVIVLDLTARGEAERLADNLAAAAQSILRETILLPGLSETARAAWTASLAAISNTAKLVTQLVRQIKAAKAQAISLLLPANLWGDFQQIRLAVEARERQVIRV